MRITRLVFKWATLSAVALLSLQTNFSARAATVADWTFEEGVPGQPVTNVLDYSGNGHTASIVWGSPTFVRSGAGAQGNVSINLPASSGFSPTNSPDFNIQEFTLEIEYKPGTSDPSYGALGGYLIGGFVPSAGAVFGLGYRGDLSRAFFGPVSGPIPSDGQSHHIAVVYVSRMATLYIDGQSMGTTNVDLTAYYPPAGTPMRLTVGSDYRGNQWCSGTIDRVRISNQALSPQDFFFAPPSPATVADWTFEEGVPGQPVTQVQDSSGNGHTGSIVWGAPTFVQSGAGSQGNVSINLPASSGFRPQDSPDFNFAGQFTWEISLKPAASDPSYGTLGGYVIGAFIPNNPSGYGIGYRSDTHNVFFGPASGPIPTDGQSHHVAVVYATGTASLYIDGQFVASTKINLSAYFLPAGTPMRLTVGSDFRGVQWVSGSIDRVRISNQPLSPQDFFFRPSIVGDGIPDSWRIKYFGTNFVNDLRAAANADPDNDGADNFQEYLAGTDPVGSNSVPVLPATVGTYAGVKGGFKDGFRTTAQFDGSITDLKYDGQGRIWLLESSLSGDLQRAETGGQRVRILDTNGVITTLTGGTNGMVDGPLSQALFSIPNGLAFDSAGNAFIADQGNSRIRKIGTNGTVSTFAGSAAGYRDGVGTNAQFNAPSGIAIDADNNVYVADWQNQKIRIITPEGAVSTFAGNYGAPIDVAIAKDGTLFVADASGGTIREISTNGVVTILATGLSGVVHVAVDAASNVYASTQSEVLSKFNPDGSRAWSVGSSPGFRNGLAATAQFIQLGRPLTLSDGSLIVGDYYEIRRITIGIPPLLLIDPGARTYTNSLAAQIHTSVAGGVVRYTLDGTTPTTNSLAYTDGVTNSITVSNATAIATTLEAVVFVNNHPVSEVASATFTNAFNLWRAQIFGPNFATNTQAAPTADPDGDGSNNYQEFLDGTNPLDPTSVKIRVAARIVPLITWNSVSNQVYRVMRLDDPSTTNSIVVAPSVLATNTTTSYIDLNPDLKAFYWIELVPPGP